MISGDRVAAAKGCGVYSSGTVNGKIYGFRVIEDATITVCTIGGVNVVGHPSSIYRLPGNTVTLAAGFEYYAPQSSPITQIIIGSGRVQIFWA
jgi:hypothetical protein